MKFTSYIYVITLLLLPSLSWAEPVVIKFSHVVAPNTPKGKAADKFKQLVEERSNQSIVVEVYHNSTLYKDNEEVQALLQGNVQIIAPALGKISQFGSRQFELFDLPFIFPNQETLYRAVDGALGQRLFQRLEAKGVIGLAFWDNGFKQISANKPVNSVTDFTGLRMRIQPSKVLAIQMQALGATPKAMPFSEVYAAMKDGDIDGSENPLSNIYTKKMHEVQKNITLSNHGYLGYGVLTNKAFWDRLKPEQRNLIAQAMKDATVYERSIAQQENAEALAKIRAANTTQIRELTEAERAQWMSALSPVNTVFEGLVGAENIKELREIASQTGKQKVAKL